MFISGPGKVLGKKRKVIRKVLEKSWNVLYSYVHLNSLSKRINLYINIYSLIKLLCC